VSRDRGETRIRRVLVALDASTYSAAALNAAAELAYRYGAELLGLYVEDINLLRLGEMPFAQEVGQFTAIRRRIDLREVERQIRAQTVRLRHMLEITTQIARIRWSFRVTRGTVVSEVLDAASTVDALVLGRAGWSLIGPRRLGSTARAVLAETPVLALIVPHTGCLGAPFLVLFDGSALGEKTLDVAAGLMMAEEGPLTVLLLTDRPEGLEPLQAQVRAWLGERNLKVRYRPLLTANVLDLVHAIHTERCGTLVVPSHSEILSAQTLQAVLDQVEVPVLLVR
jgi:nucleotide-binding universal stress UspA family protein